MALNEICSGKLDQPFHKASMCLLYEAPIFVVNTGLARIETPVTEITSPWTPPPAYKSLVHSFLVDGPPTYEDATGKKIKEMQINIDDDKKPMRLTCESKILSWSFVCITILILILLAILFIVFNV